MTSLATLTVKLNVIQKSKLFMVKSKENKDLSAVVEGAELCRAVAASARPNQ